MMIHQKKHKRFITTKIIAYGFFLTILVGSLLLMLPICQSGEMEVSYIDALFTATTSVCVTGLVTLPTYLAWSGFGQFIILILVEIGGLGIITFTMLFLLIMGKKIGLRERMLIADAYNIDTSRGLVILVKRIFLGTLAVQ
ncbi:MAG: potassium transporter KtrB, partial [Christensenellaceae bacterium]|nr:potassium transporter KtrB [Christensenellaceae bacterium]